MPSKRSRSQLIQSKQALIFVLFLTIFSVFALIYTSTLFKQPQNIKSDAYQPTTSAKASIINNRGSAISSDKSDKTFTFNFETGWNFISPPIVSSNLTAAYVCEKAAGAESVLRIIPGVDFQTVSFDCNSVSSQQKNFPLTANIAYLVKVTSPSSLTIKGKAADDSLYNVVAGWNPFGFSIVYSNPGLTVQASSLCGTITNSPYQITEIDRFQFGGWDAHICYKPFNNFVIEAGKGYVLKAIDPATGGSVVISPLAAQ